jgi:hypothetical protein
VNGKGSEAVGDTKSARSRKQIGFYSKLAGLSEGKRGIQALDKRPHLSKKVLRFFWQATPFLSTAPDCTELFRQFSTLRGHPR